MQPDFSRSLSDRRQVLQILGVGAAAGLTGALAADDSTRIKGNIKQSICRWCHGRMPIDKLCAVANKLGYKSIELLLPAEYKPVKAAGLSCAMIGKPSIEHGLNRKSNHDKIHKELTEWIEFAAAEKLPNVICMAGNRKGLDDAEGLKVCAEGLKKIVGLAEKNKVTICMEGLNSKVDHKDYMYDHTKWGIDLCKKVGSDRFKLLYDIYHMQIMEGDVIRTIRDAKEHIAHFHTGGNPGRHEIDDTQELNYSAIVKAIVATGYKGYLGQEFLPKRDPVESLAQAFRICDV